DCTASNCGRYELFRTEDGGEHWATLGNPKAPASDCSFGNLATPVFASARRGWLAVNTGAGGARGGPGGLLATDDGGTTWRCADMPQSELVSAADPLHVWAATHEPAPIPALESTDDGA